MIRSVRPGWPSLKITAAEAPAAVVMVLRHRHAPADKSQPGHRDKTRRPLVAVPSLAAASPPGVVARSPPGPHRYCATRSPGQEQHHNRYALTWEDRPEPHLSVPIAPFEQAPGTYEAMQASGPLAGPELDAGDLGQRVAEVRCE